MAWADGECSAAERDLLVQLVARHLHPGDSTPPDAEALDAFLAERLPVSCLGEQVAQLGSYEDRELALKLSYMMVRVGRRSPEEPSINAEERVAYRLLVELLDLGEETIREIQWAADADLPRKHGLAQLLSESSPPAGAPPSSERARPETARRRGQRRTTSGERHLLGAGGVGLIAVGHPVAEIVVPVEAARHPLGAQPGAGPGPPSAGSSRSGRGR